MHVHRHMIRRAMCTCVYRHVLNGQPHLVLLLVVMDRCCVVGSLLMFPTILVQGKLSRRMYLFSCVFTDT